MNKKFYPVDDKFTMNYCVYYPDNYEDLPLIVYLHGAGERGINYDHLERHGMPKHIKGGKKYNAVVLCPQCPADRVWDNMVKELKELIDKVAEKYNIKSDRISITGGSMGGFGTWMMALTYPNFFAGALPIAGGNMSWRASNLKNMPIRAYHGRNDDTVPVIYSELMVNAVNKNGGNATLAIMEGYGHNDAINAVYEDDDAMEWLISQRNVDRESVKEVLSYMF